MDESNRNAFSKVMQLLAATYDKEATMDVIEAYWGALKDLPLADVQQAAQTARMRMEWMPRPAHLRKLAGDVEPDHRAAIAWQAVRQALSQHGTYSSVNFDDPVINATIRNLGGWTELGQKDEKDFDVWTRKEFERIYQAIYTTGVTDEAAAHLVGITEHQNQGRYEVVPPVQIESSLPAPKVRMLTPKKKPGGLTAGEIVAKAFELAEKSEESA